MTIPKQVIDAIVAYGDARADNASTGSGDRLREALYAIKAASDRPSDASPLMDEDRVPTWLNHCMHVDQPEVEHAARTLMAWYQGAEFPEPASDRPSDAAGLNGLRPIPIPRDELGSMVRAAWIKWAQTQPNPKPSWLVPYADLAECDKEADRQIGEFVARMTLIADSASRSLVSDRLSDAQVNAHIMRFFGGENRALFLNGDEVTLHPEVLRDMVSSMAAPDRSSDAQPVGYMMKHESGGDVGFAWKADSPLFPEQWKRIPLYTHPAGDKK